MRERATARIALTRAYRQRWLGAVQKILPDVVQSEWHAPIRCRNSNGEYTAMTEIPPSRESIYNSSPCICLPARAASSRTSWRSDLNSHFSIDSIRRG